MDDVRCDCLMFFDWFDVFWLLVGVGGVMCDGCVGCVVWMILCEVMFLVG